MNVRVWPCVICIIVFIALYLTYFKMFQINFLISFLFLHSILSSECYNGSHTGSSQFINFKSDDKTCEEMLESFAFASANFTFCAISFARPIRLCQKCVGKYNAVESIYEDILNIRDEDEKECREKLINLDRLQVVEAGFKYVVNLWNRANCNYCFKTDSHGNPTKELTDNTIEILDLSNKTQTCIEKHKNETLSGLKDPPVCFECKEPYLTLNSRYDELKEDGFCMDIVDLLNLTRSQWSSELGCCLDRKQPEWLFIVSSVVVSCLPIAFYFAAFIFATRKNHTVITQRRLHETFNSASTSSMMCPD